MLTNVHGIIGIAIFEHSLGDGSRCVLLIRQYTYLTNSLYQCLIELRPRTPRQRYDVHIVIRHHQSMSQHLEGVEGRIDDDVCFRHLALDRIGETKEERIATGENNKG